MVVESQPQSERSTRDRRRCAYTFEFVLGEPLAGREGLPEPIRLHNETAHPEAEEHLHRPLVIAHNDVGHRLRYVGHHHRVAKVQRHVPLFCRGGGEHMSSIPSSPS